MNLCEAIEIICNDYCKYPGIESGNKLADICDKCPMNKCEDLRWADRKTENSSEKQNNCEVKNYCDDCLYTDTCDSKEFFYVCTSKATISKMEQVEDEPQTDCAWK